MVTPWSPAPGRMGVGGGQCVGHSQWKRPCLGHAVKVWLPGNGSRGLPDYAWFLPIKILLCREEAESGDSACCPGADPGLRASSDSGLACLCL